MYETPHLQSHHLQWGAEALWQRVIALQPTQPDGYKGLADVQFARGHLERALETYRRGSEAAPDSPEMHMGYAQMLEDFNDREGSERSFRRALELRPDWPMALEGLLTLIRGRADDALVACAQAIVADPKRPPQDRANVGFGLGKVFDAQGRIDAAFETWRLANVARRQQVGGYDRPRTSARVDRLIRAFSAEAIASLAPPQPAVEAMASNSAGSALILTSAASASHASTTTNPRRSSRRRVVTRTTVSSSTWS